MLSPAEAIFRGRYDACKSDGVAVDNHPVSAELNRGKTPLSNSLLIVSGLLVIGPTQVGG